jgi:hypothetical protein
MLNGRFHVTTEDVRAVAHPVLRHRVITNFNAESSGITSDTVVDRLLKEIPDRGRRRAVATGQGVLGVAFLDPAPRPPHPKVQRAPESDPFDGHRSRS